MIPLSAAVLPGAGACVLYLAFAAALLALSYRFLRRFSWPAAVVLTLLPLIFPGPALLAGRVFAPLDLHYNSMPLQSLKEELEVGDHRSLTRFDVAFAMIPFRKAVRFAIKNGEWPVYNPFFLSGDILAAAAEPAAYHPVNVLSYLLPLGPSLTFVASAVQLLSVLSAFFFNREIGCREAAAVLGATAWAFGGFMLFWIGWPLGPTVGVFPFLMLATRLVVRSPGVRSATLLALAFVLVLLGGHPESTFHGVVAGCVYGLFELAFCWKRMLAATASALGAACVAVLLCAVFLVPFLEALPQTASYRIRHSATSIPGRQSVKWELAAKRMRTAPVSFAYGVPWDEKSRRPEESGPQWYAGSLVWPLAIFGLWRGRWRGRFFLLGFAVAGFLLHISMPGISDLLARLPLFEVMVNHRLIFLTAFAVSALAALGAEAWAAEPPSRRLFWISVAVCAFLALLIPTVWSDLRAAGLGTAELTSRALREVLPVALLAAFVFRARPTRLALALLVTALVAQRFFEASPSYATYEERHLAPPVKELAALPQEEGPYRVAGFGGTLTPNLAALYELEDVRGKQAMTNFRYYGTYELWAKRRPGAPHIPLISDLSRPFLSFLNVRYVFAGPRTPREGWREAASGDGFLILENPSVLDRAFVPERVRFVPPGRRALWEMVNETDFAHRAWIEEDVEEPREVANGPGRLTARRSGLGLLLDAEMDKDGWVVVSQTFWKGWRATTGGRELDLRPANYAFLGFRLPAGRHEVELVYRPASFVLGRWLSAGTAMAAAAFYLLLWLRSKKLTGEHSNG